MQNTGNRCKRQYVKDKKGEEAEEGRRMTEAGTNWQ